MAFGIRTNQFDLAIIGPRDLTVSLDLIHEAINQLGFKPTMIVTGDATGIDSCAVDYARSIGVDPIRYVADWDYWRSQGNMKIAGPKRNARIVAHADAILVIRDRKTSGTSNTIRQAKEKGVPVYICDVTMPDQEL